MSMVLTDLENKPALVVGRDDDGIEDPDTEADDDVKEGGDSENDTDAEDDFGDGKSNY